MISEFHHNGCDVLYHEFLLIMIPIFSALLWQFLLFGATFLFFGRQCHVRSLMLEILEQIAFISYVLLGSLKGKSTGKLN